MCMGIVSSLSSPKKIVLVFLVFKMEYFSYFILFFQLSSYFFSLMQMVNQNRCMVFNFFCFIGKRTNRDSQVKLLTIILKLTDFSLRSWKKLCSKINYFRDSYLLCILPSLVYVLPKPASKINDQYYELWWFQVGDNLFACQQQVLTLKKKLCELFHIQGNQIQDSEKVNQNIRIQSLEFSGFLLILSLSARYTNEFISGLSPILKTKINSRFLTENHDAALGSDRSAGFLGCHNSYVT